MDNLLKKFFLSIMVLSSLLFVSCGDDDDDDSVSPIVGAWKMSETIPYVEKEGETVLFTGDVNAYFWYKEDGTFVEVDILTKDNGEKEYELSEHGRWTVKGDNVTQTTNFGGDFEDEFERITLQFKINGNNMSLTYKTEEKTKTIQFTKVSEGEVQSVVSAAKR